MLTVNDIKNVKFRKTNLGGYKTEDVDSFLDELQDSFEKLQNENFDLAQKLKILADRVSKYRKDEDSVKVALVNAQKLADASIKNAKQEAEGIIEDAKLKARTIVSQINDDIRKQKDTLIGLKLAVKDFRSNILSMYKDHIKLVNSFNSENRFLSTSYSSEESPKGNYDKEYSAHSVDELEKKEVVNDTDIVDVPKDKFAGLKFGDNYDISKDDSSESPLGLFN